MRRTVGLPIVIIILIFIAYAKFGYLLPGILGTGGITWSRLFQQLYVGADFMLGIPLKIVCGIVFGFIIFGVIFLRFGGGDTLMNLAYSLMGRFRGGPAKVAVISSSLFGTISGSPVANVSASGMITIPLMKKAGYQPHYAGAIEAVASTGGQIAPPIMGAAAFVLAEFLGIPYYKVAITAIIPALLFYIALFIQVDLQAIKLDLKGLPQDQIPSFKKTLSKGWIYLIPIVVLVYALFVLFLSPGVSAIYGVSTAIIISLLRKDTRALWSWGNILGVFHATNQAMFAIVAVCAGAGIIIGLVSYTGLGLSFSQILTQAAGGNLLVLAFLTAVASLILGMGMPTVAAYIMVAVLAAPAMVNLGVHPIIAHLFVLYFAVISMMTPPVCLAVFAASALAEAPYMQIAGQAVRLGIAGFVVPFAFLFNPGVVLIGSIGEIASGIFFILLAIFLFAFSFEGYLLSKLGWWERILFFIGAIILIMPNMFIRISVLLILGTLSLYHEIWKKRKTSLVSIKAVKMADDG